jgi:hypothetical protein
VLQGAQHRAAAAVDDSEGTTVQDEILGHESFDDDARVMRVDGERIAVGPDGGDNVDVEAPQPVDHHRHRLQSDAAEQRAKGEIDHRAAVSQARDLLWHAVVVALGVTTVEGVVARAGAVRSG